MPVVPLSFTDFRREMAFHLRWGDIDLRPERERQILKSFIQSAVRKVFFPLDPRPGPTQGQLHEWSWASPLRSLIVRTAVVGALTAVPTRIGGQFIAIDSATAIFDSDLLGLALSFDVSGQRFLIAEFVSQTRLKLVAALEPGARDTLLGERRSATVTGTGFERLATKILESSSTRAFYDGMVLDEVQFATSGTKGLLIRVETATKHIFVFGDVTGEGANDLTVVKKVFGTKATNSGVTGRGQIKDIPGDTVRSDMATENDTVSIVGGTGTEYTISTVVLDSAGDTLRLSTALAGGDALGVDTDIEIHKKFVSADYSIVGTVGNESLVAVDETGFFVPNDVGQRLAFVNEFLNVYEIIDVVATDEGRRVRVSGDVRNEPRNGRVSVVRTGGTIDTSATRTYDGVSTILTATAAVFDATMVGLVMEFPLPIGGPSRKYVIAEFTSTTVVKVNGDATEEKTKFLVVGPSDLGANDTFTVANTGKDYELPIDFGGFDGPLTFATDGWSNSVEVTSEFNVRIARQRSSGTGRPKIANARARIHDGKFTQRYDLLLWPEPDGKYTLQFPMLVVLPEINEENPYPPGGAAYGQLYLDACLAEVDQRYNEKRGLAWTTFQEQLAAMIALDGSSTGAEQLGPGYEEGRTVGRTVPQSSGVTYVPT